MRLAPFIATIVAALVLGPVAAHAKTITVTGTGDTIAVDGLVTLREAISAANTNGPAGDAPAGDNGLDTINFNIAGLPGTVHTIQPQSALPTVTQTIVINGYSQLGASQNTLAVGSNAFLAIEIDGTQSGFTAGLTISGGGSTVQGLIINRFKNEGILLFSGGSNVIRGNFLGTDATGKLDRGNGITGISVLSGANTIGGTVPADRNLIAGNDFAGVSILNPTANNNLVQGNLIGTDDTGVAGIPNGSVNGGPGVRIVNGTGNTVGGLAATAGNVIAFNTGPGVRLDVSAGVGNPILGNAIHDNGGPGIDLNDDGVTPNDPLASLDDDTGPNDLQNFPVITSVASNGTGTTVGGYLPSAASTQYRVEFFAGPACDPSGNGQGATYLGAQDVTTHASGRGTFLFTLPTALPRGQVVTATATSPGNATSELSACTAVGAVVPGLSPLGFATLLVLLAVTAMAGSKARL